MIIKVIQELDEVIKETIDFVVHCSVKQALFILHEKTRRIIRRDTIWKMYLKNGKMYQCTKFVLGGLKMSIASLGLKNMDIRITIKWGWK